MSRQHPTHRSAAEFVVTPKILAPGVMIPAGRGREGDGGVHNSDAIDVSLFLGTPAGTQSTMNSFAPPGARERWGSAPSATW